MNNENIAPKVNLDYSKYLKEKKIPIYISKILEKISKYEFQQDLKNYLVQFQCFLSDDKILKTIFVNLGWNDKNQTFSHKFNYKELDQLIRREYGININYNEKEDFIIEPKNFEIIKNFEEIESDKINDNFGLLTDLQNDELNQTISENLDFKIVNSQKLNDILHRTSNYDYTNKKLPSNISKFRSLDEDITKNKYNYYTNKFLVDKKNNNNESNSCLRNFNKSENKIIEVENSNNCENDFLNELQISNLQTRKKSNSLNDENFEEESNIIKKPIPTTTATTNFCSFNIQKEKIFEKFLHQNLYLNINKISENLNKQELVNNSLFLNNFNNNFNQFNSITNYNPKCYDKILNNNDMKNNFDDNSNVLDNEPNKNHKVLNHKLINDLNCYNPITILNKKNFKNDSFNFNKRISISPKQFNFESFNNINQNQNQPQKCNNQNKLKTHITSSYNFGSSIFSKNSNNQTKTVLKFPRSPGKSFISNAHSAFNPYYNEKEIPLNSPNSTKSLDLEKVNCKKQNILCDYSSQNFNQNNICNFINYNFKKQELKTSDRNPQTFGSFYKNYSKSNPVTIISNKISLNKLEKFNNKKLSFFENDENEKLPNMNKMKEIDNFIGNDNILNLENSIFIKNEKETTNNINKHQNLNVPTPCKKNYNKIINYNINNLKANEDKVLNLKEDSKLKISNLCLGFKNKKSIIGNNLYNPNITIINENNSFKIIINKQIINLIENEDLNIENLRNISNEKINLKEKKIPNREIKHKRNIKGNKRFFDEKNFLYENSYYKSINNGYTKRQNKFIYKVLNKIENPINLNNNILSDGIKVNYNIINENKKKKYRVNHKKINNKYEENNNECSVKFKKILDRQYVTKNEFNKKINHSKENFNFPFDSNFLKDSKNKNKNNLKSLDDRSIDINKRSNINEEKEIQQISRKRKRKIKNKKFQIEYDKEIYISEEFPSKGISFGLKEISKNVLKIIKNLKSTTYKEISDLIIRDINFDLDASKDEKNIRRRIYDSLNVMKAINIFKKEKNQKNIIFDNNKLNPFQNIINNVEESTNTIHQNLKFETQRSDENLQNNQNNFYENKYFVGLNFFDINKSNLINGFNSRKDLNKFGIYDEDILQNKSNLNFEGKENSIDESKNRKFSKNFICFF